MRDIVIIGLNHKTAPIELRERLAFSENEIYPALDGLISGTAVEEAVLLSTCNRVEAIIASDDAAEAIAAAKAFLSEFRDVPANRLENAFYAHNGDTAVRHLFRVASSLDSMVVGEPQILGQVKDAYRAASEKGASGPVLNKLMHRTFSVAKRVRTETGIGDHAVSISYAAIELGRKIFGTLNEKTVLLVGAGEMAELAVEHLVRSRVRKVYVANRTFESGLELANRFKGEAIRFDEVKSHLQRADIIISSTGSPDYTVTYGQVKASMRLRRNRPVFFIDIAVPRDIDPQINQLTNAYVYDIDDLQNVIEENIDDRKRAALRGERIIDKAVIQFREWCDSLDTVPTIKALREKAETIANTEVEKTLRTLDHLSNEEASAIRRMAEALVNKLLHDPVVSLKNSGKLTTKAAFLDITRKLFNLDA